MKRIIGYILLFFCLFPVYFVHTDGDKKNMKENITGLSAERLRNGNVELDDIPTVILNLIEVGVYAVGGISIIFIIVGAYKILFGSLQQDTNKGRDTIVAAILGLILTYLAWFIVNFVMSNF